MPRFLFRFAFCALLLLPPALMKADDLTVFAAASLQESLQKIAADYEKTSGDHIAVNYGASGTLEIQIRHGASADIFFSADEAKMNDLAKDHLLEPGTRRDLLANTLVIVVPGDSNLALKSAKDLANPAVKRIAVGDTRIVPAGIYAKEYLTKIGLWSQLEPRVIPVENVRAALAAVESANADAGFVYKTDALHSTKAKIGYEIPLAEGPAIVYPAALVKGTKHQAAAAKFLSYLASSDARKVFTSFGFLPKSAK
jgi:molybdate transport system substrate-binding protein